MSRLRVAFAVPGLLLLAFGAFRLATEVDPGDLLVLAVWMIAAVALHDGLVAPLTVGAGVLLTRVPPRARRYVQGGLVAGALVTVIALPLIGRRGSQPAAEAILLRDYTGNLLILLALTGLVAAALYLRRLLDDRAR